MKPYYTMDISQGCQHDQLYGHEVYKASGLQAWALKHKATVEKIPHWESCALEMHRTRFWREEPYPECSCPRGDALREIEELLK